MTMYPIFELELLEQWLEMKIKSLDTKASCDDPLQYSEANLTRAILKFVKFMAAEHRDKQETNAAMTMYDYGLPYYSATSVPPNRVTVTPGSGTPSSTETICTTCKAQSPGATHCVHRTVYKHNYQP